MLTAVHKVNNKLDINNSVDDIDAKNDDGDDDNDDGDASDGGVLSKK